MSDPQFSRTWLFFFFGFFFFQAFGDWPWYWLLLMYIPTESLGRFFVPQTPSHVNCWPLGVVGFNFPPSFWLAFLQQLGMLSILYGGGGLGLYCPFFFFLKGCEDNLALVQLPESRLCLEFISLVPAAGHFLRVAVIHRTPGLGNWGACEQEWSSCSSRKCSQNGSTFPGPRWFLGATRALGQVGFRGCEMEWNVPEQTGKGLSLTTFPP